MTQQQIDGAPDEDPVLSRLDLLADLFRRRLLDDRVKTKTLDELTERVRAAEEGHFRQVLHPLVRRLAFVVDRLDRYVGPDPNFVESVRDEILDALLDQGVRTIPVGSEFDPQTQEAIFTPPDSGTRLGVGSIRQVRRGFAHGSWVFRPAQVDVVASAPQRADDVKKDAGHEAEAKLPPRAVGAPDSQPGHDS